MALVLSDRVKETTATTGTATYTLAGAVNGFETFASIGDGNTTYYACTDGTDFEVGIGTFTASGTTLARTTILQSSNSDNAVSWSSGTKTIFCTQPAEKAVFRDASGHIIALDGRNLTNVNATTLDSVDSTSFLRSDADDNKTSGNLTFEDNIKARFGTSGDLQIYHDGSNSFINDVGTGSVVMRTNGSFFQFDTPSTVMAKFIKDGAVELYHDNNKKLETTSTGATVTGSLATTSGVAINNASGYGNIEIGGTSGAFIDLKNPNSDDFDLRLITTGTGGEVVSTNTLNVRPTVGAVNLYHDNELRFTTTTTGAKITGGTGDGVLIIEADTDNANESDNALLQLTQDGGLVNAYIGFDGVNNLFIKATSSQDIQLLTASSEVLAKGTGNGAFELYHDNSKKLETTSTGATITGTSKATTAFQVDGVSSGSALFGAAISSGGAKINANSGSDAATFIDFDATNISASGGDVTYRFGRGTTEGSSDMSQLIMYAHDGANSPVFIVTSNGDVTISSTDGGGSENPTLDLYRNSASPANGDDIGHITFSGENSAGEKIVYGEINADMQSVTDGSEHGRFFISVMQSGSASNRIFIQGNGPTKFLNRPVEIGSSSSLRFQGSTDDSNETTLAVIDPTADRTVSLPDATGTVLLNTGNQSITGDLTLTSTDAGSSGDPELILYRNSSSPADNDASGVLRFSANNDASEASTIGQIVSRITDVTDGTEDGTFELQTISGGTVATNFRLDANANVGIRLMNGGEKNIRFDTGTPFNGSHIDLTPASATGARTITLPDSTGTVQVTSSSDRRLKKNIEPAQSASQKIDDINVYQFDWIEDGKHEDFGVVAQEMQEVFPDCVAVQDPETGYLGIDYSKLVPVLLKEIKDLRARVADLENK